jgi:signal transduction histidine kinase/CheY-like chemotaxis protein
MAGELPILNMEIKLQHDVVYARQRVRQVASFLGFDSQDQTRLSTAVSEIARNAFKYAGSGKVEFSIAYDAPEGAPLFVVKISDRGPGISQLDAILSGSYRSETGMGLGILGSRKLMDHFEISSLAGKGTSVYLGKYLAAGALPLTPKRIIELGDELSRRSPQDPFHEVQHQNQELLKALEALRNREEELSQLNHELEDTNRGVVALYAELDEKADYLQRANEIKTRFLSNMTHEFRTPLNSILSLARLLLDQIDGPLLTEQEKQVMFIRKSAEDLSELVNDLLDLAKVEAGKVQIRPTEFKVSDLFAALRGMLKPLLASNSSVRLNFEEPIDIPLLETDEAKVSQILRNFISNALKFTESGEVKVSARVEAGDTVVLEVSDTGIGIDVVDQEKIFEEFSQIDSHLQGRAQGTGLGLPLTRKLAGLLGGSVLVQSERGRGSTFSVVLPVVYRGPGEVNSIPDLSCKLDPTRAPVLVIEDNRESVFIYEKYLKASGFQVIPARTLKEARLALNDFKPVAVVADILLETENTWDFLAELKSNEDTRDIPVLIVTMVDNVTKAQALGADAFHSKPVEREWLITNLTQLTQAKPKQTLLLIDDDEVSRYILKALLPQTRYRIIEAANGVDGVRMAQEERPQAIFLDISMADLDGFQTLERLKGMSGTASIPVIIRSSTHLSEREMDSLSTKTVDVLSKETKSREESVSLLRTALSKAGLDPTQYGSIIK